LFALLFWLLPLGSLPSGEDIAWCYWPKGYLLFKRSGARGRLIFDTDHNIVSDPNIPSHLKSERIRLLKEIGQRAEIILSSSRTMIEWYNKLGVRETVLLMNGVDPSRFNNVRATTLDIPTPVIGYVGSLSRWVLYEWLVALAKEQPDWNFIIIGRPVSDDQYKELELFPNVYFLGPKTYQEVPSFMKSFDIALGLYRPHPALDVNSMKLYEYIAAGVPVVSSNYHPNLSFDFSGLIETAATYQSFKQKISETLSTRDKIGSKEVNDFLRASSWENRVFQFIQNHLKCLLLA